MLVKSVLKGLHSTKASDTGYMFMTECVTCINDKYIDTNKHIDIKMINKASVPRILMTLFKDSKNEYFFC